MSPLVSLLRPAPVALFIVFVAGAAIAGAWFIELVLGVKPCPLCLQQRIPYYAGVPLAALALVPAMRGATRSAALMLGCIAIVFLVGAGIGAYHAGIEWKLWTGPAGCSAGATAEAGMQDFLKQLATATVIRCDEVSFRLLGLSLAVWNTIISGAVAIAAGTAARHGFRAHGSSSLSQ
jgi:disulfide bond formation protein DsbB